jgi:hypothetical protein
MKSKRQTKKDYRNRRHGIYIELVPILILCFKQQLWIGLDVAVTVCLCVCVCVSLQQRMFTLLHIDVSARAHDLSFSCYGRAGLTVNDAVTLCVKLSL